MQARLVRNGLVAGAAGVTALNAVTYADMALRGRPASDTPERTVALLLDRFGVGLPKDGRDNRLTGLGALNGIEVGLAGGVLGAALRRIGLRGPLAAVLTGAGVMAGTDLSMARLGVSDPRTWTAADWIADALPHLAYGAAVQASLAAAERRDAIRLRPRALPLKAFLLGWASGGRTSYGPTALAVTARRSDAIGRLRAVGAVLSSVGETVVDKLPQTPSRLQPEVLGGRIVTGAVSAGLLGRRGGGSVVGSAVLGAAGAAAGSFAGFRWRQVAAQRVPDWQAALVEDVVTALVAASAAR